MKSASLLEKIRTMKRDFLQSDDQGYVLEEGGKRIAEATGAAILIIGGDGNILGGHPGEVDTGGRVEKLLGEGTLAGKADLMEAVGSGEPVVNEPYPGGESGLLYSLIPAQGKDKRVASLLLFHPERSLDDNEIVLAEVGSSLVGMYVLHKVTDQEEEDARNKKLAEVAFDSLSYSEVEAIREILKNIENNESVVVASKIADNLGITRSVIVNALRKFESAGIIESRSLGMKGTFIRVINPEALELVASRSDSLGFLP